MSQLAGEEIDRLLAEADGVAAPHVNRSAPPLAADDPAKSKLDSEDDTPEVKPLTASTVGTPPMVVPLDENAPASEKTSASIARPKAPATAPALDAHETPAAAPPEGPPSPGPENAVTKAAVPMTASELESQIMAEEHEKTPILVRLLEWINAPLDSLDEPIRDAIGYAALMTIANALAVLAYVKFVRKH